MVSFGHHRGEQHLAPGGHEGVDGDRDDARHRGRHDDAEQRAERAAAVDLRRLVQVARDRVEVADQHPDRERQREGEVGEDQPAARAVERDPGGVADVDEDQEQRQQEEDAGEHLRGQHRDREDALAAEAVAADGVGREDRDHHRADASPSPPRSASSRSSRPSGTVLQMSTYGLDGQPGWASSGTRPGRPAAA